MPPTSLPATPLLFNPLTAANPLTSHMLYNAAANNNAVSFDVKNILYIIYKIYYKNKYNIYNGCMNFETLVANGISLTCNVRRSRWMHEQLKMRLIERR